MIAPVRVCRQGTFHSLKVPLTAPVSGAYLVFKRCLKHLLHQRCRCSKEALSKTIFHCRLIQCFSEISLQAFAGICYESLAFAGFCLEPLEFSFRDLQVFVMSTKEYKTTTVSTERSSEKPAKTSQSTKKPARNLQKSSEKPRINRHRIIVSDDISAPSSDERRGIRLLTTADAPTSERSRVIKAAMPSLDGEAQTVPQTRKIKTPC